MINSTSYLLALATLGLTVVLLMYHWHGCINAIVPDAYLDEVFHVPQAQAYWAGQWRHWDPKITTPPGLYLFSVLLAYSRSIWNDTSHLTTQQTRQANVFLSFIALPQLFYYFLQLEQLQEDVPFEATTIHLLVNLPMFPLFFFFSGLYYTDILSTVTVMCAYVAFLKREKSRSNSGRLFFEAIQFVSGVAALVTRQTNIFWVAVFLGGLQVVETVKKATSESVHDANVSNASVEDYLNTILSITKSVLTCMPTLLRNLWPQISLLVCFTAFVLWNGGVVLGDKDNHVASLHLAQLLYLWPFITFFSWPLLVPQLVSLSVLKSRLPRGITALLIAASMCAIVHYNTIVHPFTLADNRHYMFYVFRILLRHPFIKYAAVPVYASCAWLVWGALGDSSADHTARAKAATFRRGGSSSFAMVWLASTSLSLVTAPLVEPRYFILPWLMWRLEVSVPAAKAPNKSQPRSKKSERAPTRPGKASKVHQMLLFVASEALWIESVWFILVNAVTCYMFLYSGFEWKQEPGQVQRFMW